jgi:hypothetical protein
MLSPRLKRRIKVALYFFATLIVGLWGLNRFVDYTTSLGAVGGGFEPGLAANDIKDFEAVVHPTETTPSLSVLRASGKIFFVEPGTHCRLIRLPGTTEPCNGAHYIASVKLLEGPRNGNTVWMCSDSILILHPWP